MELRKDYILDRWVVISEGRGSRPKQFKKEENTVKKDVCYFCPGNEHLTPAEISRVEKDGRWVIRVFPNKFPAVDETGFADIRTDNTFFTYSSAFGRHEVVVEAPEDDKQLYDLSQEDIKEVLKVYVERIQELSKLPETKYVVVFKNHGREAGTSLVHTHTQIASLNKVPTLVEEEVNVSKNFGSCPYCSIIEIEKGSDRRCFENSDFVAFTPYASRFNYEIWLFSKKHYKNMTELSDNELSNLAKIMVKILQKIKKLGCSYNFVVHYAPENEDLHFHIEFLPRMATWGGFEFSTDITINSVTPEIAAEFYRE